MTQPVPESDSDDKWVEFFDATTNREPRELLVQALPHVPKAGKALDLGCGCGNDTCAIMQHGLHITAIDAHAEAVARTQALAEALGLQSQLNVYVCPFEDLNVAPHTFDFVYAGFSLPFCPRTSFDIFWNQLVAAIKPGGIFAGQLFGERDEWASSNEHAAQVFLTMDEYQLRTQGFDAIHFEEVEQDGTTALNTPKHWHVYHFILQRQQIWMPDI